MRISITGGRVLDPSQNLDAVLDLHLEEGKILALGAAPADFSPQISLNAAGQVVSPGFIDLSCHLREPGPSYKGSLASETAAALAGGFTLVCARPDTSPPLDSPAIVRVVNERAALANQAKVLPVGALTQGLQGQLLSNMAGLKAAGCVAVTNLRQPVENNLVLRRCLEYAATNNLLVIFYPEDASLANKGCAHEGALATQLGLDSIPSSAETLAVAQILLLIQQTGIRAHFAHLSTAGAVAQIQQAQAEGLEVSADVALSHLLFTDATLEAYDSNFHVQPPLRSEKDRLALMQGLRSGVINALSSGHLPHEAAAKMAPFAASEPGMSSLQQVLPQMLKLVAEGQLSLAQMIERLSCAPAKILGLKNGSLKVGAPADVCIFDPQKKWRLDSNSNFSVGQNTPFWQQEVRGQVTACVVEGQLRYQLSNQLL